MRMGSRGEERQQCAVFLINVTCVAICVGDVYWGTILDGDEQVMADKEWCECQLTMIL